MARGWSGRFGKKPGKLYPNTPPCKICGSKNHTENQSSNKAIQMFHEMRKKNKGGEELPSA